MFGWLFDSGHDLEELYRRLGTDREHLEATEIRYQEFSIPKRSGGTRRIQAPDKRLKNVQRLIIRRLLG